MIAFYYFSDCTTVLAQEGFLLHNLHNKMVNSSTFLHVITKVIYQLTTLKSCERHFSSLSLIPFIPFLLMAFRTDDVK